MFIVNGCFPRPAKLRQERHVYSNADPNKFPPSPDPIRQDFAALDPQSQQNTGFGIPLLISLL
jgi:hypothetical protein